MSSATEAPSNRKRITAESIRKEARRLARELSKDGKRPPPKRNSTKKAAGVAPIPIKSSTNSDTADLAQKKTNPSKAKQIGRKKNDRFPNKLMFILEESEKNGEEEIISFLPHGKSFAVHDIDRFVEEVMPRHFQTLKYSSFVRQLNFYGFRRVSEPDGSYAYFHENFEKSKKVGRFFIKRKKHPECEQEMPVPKMTPIATTEAPENNRGPMAEESAMEEEPARSTVHDPKRSADLHALRSTLAQTHLENLSLRQLLIRSQTPATSLLLGTPSTRLGLLREQAETEELLRLSTMARPTITEPLGILPGAAPVRQTMYPPSPSLSTLRPLTGLLSGNSGAASVPTDDKVLRRLHEANLAARRRHATMVSLFQSRQLEIAADNARTSLARRDSTPDGQSRTGASPNVVVSLE
mmetsp:Transcript_30990/g.45969  ORF Transcript_30990/g.45969 Transcript_30990/m.45969 type:complete len:410 (-) Transcript_30990:141-1370(-)|eukprot:CAMPEP_0194032614 /NCGR_PEP_ID=MMETSP0009_2-20130614/5515_1 /TAXON_ID=210454 /ORGANISM="Grammatophora oceanica, Strain CCMP 410" /LENGTH=409 /DNA_ID=CAMNT_0038673109 /DNA_START=79 /DNA_END=1308 /DNA_ORIENTATION=-